MGMEYRIMYVVKKEDAAAAKQFINKMQSSGIQTVQIKANEKCIYYESVWDDAIPIKVHNARNAGAKPKEILYKGKNVSCGFIYLLREEKHLSDAEVGALFDISESTVSRRRKKHMADGNFYGGSEVTF